VVQAILRPPVRCFGKTISKQPSDGCIALIDLFSTMLNGKRPLQGNSGVPIASFHEETPLLSHFDSPVSQKFQTFLLDVIVDFEVDISLIPAVLNLLMEAPQLTSTQLVQCAGNIRKSLAKYISSSSDSTHTVISLIPSWILSSIVKACFFFSQHRNSVEYKTEKSKEKSDDFIDVVSSWISLLRLSLEISFLPWTFKSSLRRLDGVRTDWTEEMATNDFDPSLVVCILDLQLRQSFEISIVIINTYASLIRTDVLFKDKNHHQTETAGGDWKDELTETKFCAGDLLLLTLLLHSTSYRQPVLRLLLEVVVKLLQSSSSDHQRQLALDTINIPGAGDHSSLFLKLALHCVESTTYSRFTQLGTSIIGAIHRFASEIICAIFVARESQRRAILTLCFASSPLQGNEWHQMQQKHVYGIISRMRAEFACGSLEYLANKHGNLLLPLSRVILDFLPYLTTSHPHNPTICSRLLAATLPLSLLDQSFQTQIIIFLRKLLMNRSLIECSIAFHGISHLLANRLVPTEVQNELFDILTQSSRLPFSLRQSLNDSISFIAEAVFKEFDSENGPNGSQIIPNNEQIRLSSTNHLDMAFQFIKFVRSSISRHWTKEDAEDDLNEIDPSGFDFKFEFSSFFEPAPLFLRHSHITLTDSMADVVLLLATGSLLYGKVISKWPEAESVLDSSKLWQIHYNGWQLLNALISTTNLLGNVAFATFEVLQIRASSVSNLKRRVSNLDTQYAVLTLPLHTAPIDLKSVKEQQIVDLQITPSIISMDHVDVKSRVDAISDTYSILTEVLFDEARDIASSKPSFFVLNENSSLSLSTALTKAQLLLELRSTMIMYAKLNSAPQKRNSEKDSSILISNLHNQPDPAHSLTIESIMMIMRRFTMKETLSDAELDDSSDPTGFLPKPSIVAIFDVLTSLNLLLQLFKMELGSLNGDGIPSPSINKTSHLISSLQSLDTISKLFNLSFTVLEILTSRIGDDLLPDDVNLNAIVDIVFSNPSDCITLALNGSKGLLLEIFESLLEIILHMKWNAESVIDASIRTIFPSLSQLDLPSISSSANAKKRSRNSSNTSNTKETQQPLLNANKKPFTGTTNSNDPEHIHSLAPHVPHQLVSCGLLCMYFAKLMMGDLSQAADSKRAMQYVQVMTVLSKCGKSVATKKFDEEGEDREVTMDAGRGEGGDSFGFLDSKYFQEACTLVLRYLSAAASLKSNLLRVLLTFVFETFPNKSHSMVLVTALIESAASDSSDSPPRQRADRIETALVDHLKDLKITENDNCKDVALDIGLDYIFQVIAKAAGSSFSHWQSHSSQIGLISLALRKMSIASLLTSSPRIWMKFISVCSKLVTGSRRQISRVRSGFGSDAMATALHGADNKSHFDDSTWASEGWLTSLVTLGGFLRLVCKRLRSSFTKQQESRIPTLIGQIELFELSCHDVADRLSGRNKTMLLKALSFAASKVRIERNIPKSKKKSIKSSNTRSIVASDEDSDDSEESDSQDSFSWDSEIGSNDEDDFEIRLNYKSSGMRSKDILRSVNPFIDGALQEEEIFFQDEDDYADLEDWIEN
jgi:hypothetical protein